MFGKNTIVGEKFFKDDPENTLRVTSVFYTIQGEGIFSGRPAVFIRLAHCNLACSFCDTYFDSGELLTFEQLEVKVMEALKRHFGESPPTWLFDDDHQLFRFGMVITGGEPTLQKNLTKWLENCGNQFEWTQIESNGIVYRELPRHTTYIVSPKCSEKDGKAVKYLKPNKKVLEVADCLKFVVTADPDSPYHTIPDWAVEWAFQTGNDIYISPMNMYNKLPQQAKSDKDQNQTTIEQRSTIDEVISFWEPGLLDMQQNQKNHQYAAKYCLDNGFVFNLQAHLYAGLA